MDTCETLWGVFAATVEKFPDRVAVVEGAESLTYRELWHRAMQVAGALQEHGFQAGDRVGLRMVRGVEACAGILGCLRLGVAYVPCDPSFPADRVAAIWDDAAVKGVLEREKFLPGSDVRSFAIREFFTREAMAEVGVGAESETPAYLIFTSGSTGKPKGVVVPNRAVVAFIQGEREFFADVTENDRIAHGFSLAFDAAVEELWLAWSRGGCLVVMEQEWARSPVAMPQMLSAFGVTVWSTVPTFLGAIEGDLPTLRLIIVGGEACPAELVKTYARLGCRLANTYGPTEAAVVATAEYLEPGEPVRIGPVLPGYQAWVVSEEGNRLGAGEMGELWIGGRGVALGYWERPELTAEKFVRPEWAAGELVYRTGDVVSCDERGRYSFHGRIDDQIKLRGYRVELGEIENRMMEFPGVAVAAVKVWRDESEWLAGYVVWKDGISPDEAGLRDYLKVGLPSYMRPARVEFLERMPTLVSGKVDKKQLLKPEYEEEVEESRDDWSDAERLTREMWRVVLPGAAISRESDFFDLGGHSLAAATLATKLRQDARYAGISVSDVYQNPKMADFAKCLEAMVPIQAREKSSREEVDQGIRWRHFWCGFAQLFALYPMVALASPAWLMVWAIYHICVLRDSANQVMFLVLGGAMAALSSGFFQMAVAILAKWILLGRVKPGRYRLWGFWHLKFWFVQRLMTMAHRHSMRGTPLGNTYFRMLGAKIGAGVHLETLQIGLPDMVTIGAGATVGCDTSMLGYTVEAGEILVGTIEIGENACIGAKCLFAPGTRIEADAELEDETLLQTGEVVPAGEIWGGSPAKRVGRNPDAGVPYHAQATSWQLRCCYSIANLLLVAIPLLAWLPGAFLLGWVDRYCDYSSSYVDLWKLALASIPASGLYVVTMALLVVLMKWMILGRSREGSFALHSQERLRHWFVESLMNVSLESMFPFFATVYTATWFRMLGAKIGKDAEVSTAQSINPDLLELGEGVFVADAVCLGAAHVRRGVVTLGKVTVGDRSFLGNSAVVPGGTTIGKDSLVGVLSRAPESDLGKSDGKSWLGVPSFELPHRLQSEAFDEHLTFSPPRHLVFGRAFVEFWRIVLPGTLTGFSGFVMFLLSDDWVQSHGYQYGKFVLFFPFILLGFGLVMTLITIALKWLIVGRAREEALPLWSWRVWFTEFGAALHEQVAMPSLVNWLVGTPMLPWYFRAMGAKFGKRVYCESTYITEFDLVHVGDDAMVNFSCDLQTHLFEDRVMKMSHVRIGAKASVGTLAVVLYDSHVEEGATVEGLSLVMKGEVIPADTRWAGVPVERIG